MERKERQEKKMIKMEKERLENKVSIENLEVTIKVMDLSMLKSRGILMWLKIVLETLLLLRYVVLILVFIVCSRFSRVITAVFTFN